MKKILHSLIIIIAILSVLACGSVDKSAEKTTTGHASGSKIVIYTSMYEDIISAVDRALDRVFPGVDTEFLYGGTGIIQAKIAAERASNMVNCDMLMVAEPAYSIELKELGLLHAYKSKEIANLDYEYDPEGYWYPVRVSNMVLAYNPEKYSKSAIPNSFYDFANDSGVRGAISMRNPLVSGTSMATVGALRDKYGYAYFDALSRQNIQIEYGSESLITKLENGEYKVIMILEESILKLRQEKKSRLEVIYPADGTVIIPSSIMIIAERWSANKNIPAAEAISDWFLGADGQSAIVDGWMHSVRKNFSKQPYDSIPINQIRANSIPVSWESNYRQREEIQDKFQEILANRK